MNFKFPTWAAEVIFSLSNPDDFWAGELEMLCEVFRNDYWPSLAKRSSMVSDKDCPIAFERDVISELDGCLYTLTFYCPADACLKIVSSMNSKDILTPAISCFQWLVAMDEQTDD